jgi:hypothetical protein
MAKWAYNGIADYGLNSGFQQVAIRVAIATAQPASYANFTTFAVGTLACASANFTLGTGDTNGRKLSFGPATIAVGTSGTVNHIAFAATAGAGTLVFVGTCAPTSVTAGGTVVLSAWDVDEINDPT